METHKAADLVTGALSELRSQSQESTTILDNPINLQDDVNSRIQTEGAFCLGGIRAYNHYTAEKFKRGVCPIAFDASFGFDSKTQNLYFHGPTGSGKSHLAAIAARRRFEKRGWEMEVRTISQMQLSRALRGCKDAAQEANILTEYSSCEVLVLEDLGVAKDTDFLLSALYELVNYRYQDMPHGLIVTSNLSLGELAQKFGDDRVSSRLAQMCKVFSLQGVKDYRVPEKKL